MQISEILKDLRTEKGFTQGQLAQFLGITQDSISLWEKGKRTPDTQYIIRLCDVFEVSADYLLGRSDDLGNVSVQSVGPTLTQEERALLQLYRDMRQTERVRFIAYGEGLHGVPLNSTKKAKSK